MMRNASSLALILANLVPLGGVLLLDWQVYDVVMLYWAENVVIGIINILRMARCKGGLLLPAKAEQQIGLSLTETQATKLSLITGGLIFFLIPFFVFHYGMFCYGHLMAITAIFGDGPSSVMAIAKGWEPAFWLAIAAIFASHLISFGLNFIGAGEYRRTNLRQLMQRPYGRIVALHLAVIFGAALIMWLGSPVYMLVVLVIIKIAIDLKMHTVERLKFSVV
jgi:hypothetical protein